LAAGAGGCSLALAVHSEDPKTLIITAFKGFSKSPGWSG
jgi:hypothetical protein